MRLEFRKRCSWPGGSLRRMGRSRARYTEIVDSTTVKALARECGFELAGVASALPSSEFAEYQSWVGAGFAGEMTYLTDRRAEVRNDPRNLLPSARSIICVGKLYNGPQPYS